MILDYRKINGYPDYIISNNGIVWSTKNGMVREMKPNFTMNGYKKICLYKDGIKKTHTIHSLVGNAFIGLRTGEMTFDHIDRNKTNNRADNIRLATKSEQQVNTNTSKNNKLGEKYICIQMDKRNGRKFYTILIRRNGKEIFRKCINIKKYSLEDAKKIRDDFLLTL
tara:strand:+ start:913 stop:1413 length:501 start_codon:yes stop_codon:yes gene_type:complete